MPNSAPPTGYPYQLPPSNTQITWDLDLDIAKEPITCTCGEAAISRSKNHWADCALAQSSSSK